jgi:hypothetical protein
METKTENKLQALIKMAQAKKEAAAKAKADNLPKTKPDPKPAK